MITFADGSKPPIKDAIAAAKIPFADLFKFNNSALYSTNEDDKEGDNYSEMFWKMGMNSFKDFFTHLTRPESRSLLLTKEVLEEHQKLEAIIEGLQAQIRNVLLQIDVLHQEQRILKTQEAEMDAKKDFM